MNLRDKCLNHLVNNGMFTHQAEEVMKKVMDDPANEAMAGRWSDDESGYPSQVISMALMIVNTAAVEWIDANCPKAWYRPMFASD